jgi:arginase family enzyme
MTALQKIEGPVYVSLDGDVLDPVWAPDCCCPEPFGMAPADLLEMCTALGSKLQVIGADVAEISGRSGGTSEILLRCVHALFEQHNTRDC